jgi:DNA-binding MarR family transcriptional regulator
MKMRGKKISEEMRARGKSGISTSKAIWTFVIVYLMAAFFLFGQLAAAPVITNEDTIGTWEDTFEDNFGIDTTDCISISSGGAGILQPIDGTDWTKQAMEFDESGVGKGTVIRDFDHTYKLWYSGFDGSNWRILYAESQDGRSWTIQGVAIDLGESGEPDAENALWPTVIKDNDANPSDIYKMWYSGYDGVEYKILYATSPDGIEWTKLGKITSTSFYGKSDFIGKYPSSVLMDTGGTYKMWFHGLDGALRIEYATSSNGLNWKTHGVVMDVSPSGSLDSYGVYSPSVILDENKVYNMWYTGTDGTYDRIFYASSFDGIKWFKQGLAVDIGSFDSQDYPSAKEPTVLKDWDGFYKMWYIGSDGNNDCLMRATLSLGSIEDYRFDFSTSNEGFSTEVDYPNSVITWNAFSENIYAESDRQDAGDEFFSKPLSRELTSDSDSWTLTARFEPIYRGNWNGIYPIYITGSKVDTVLDGPSTIAIFYGSGDFYLRGQYPHAYHVIYVDASGEMRVKEYVEATSNLEHSFYLSYDAQSKELTMTVIDFYGMIKLSETYIIGTNPGDGFTLHKIGVASQGLSRDEEPETIGWIDDINFVITENQGSLVSEAIELPSRGTWSTVSIQKTEAIPDDKIYVSILDAETSVIIPGFEDLKGTNFDISSIDTTIYPAIKLKATFLAGSSGTPVLHEWKVTWQNDVMVIDPDPLDGEPQNEAAPGFGFAVAAAIIIVLLSIAFAGRSEVWRYRTIPLFFPLYSRLRKDELLEQKTRNLIYQHIISNPGDNFNHIRDKLNLNNGTLIYHLQALEREEYIKSMKDGIYKRFYPMDVKVQRVNGFGIQSVQGKMIMHMIHNPGLTQKEIASALGISQQVVSYHLKLLAESGHIRAKKQGKTNRYYVNEWVPQSNM